MQQRTVHPTNPRSTKELAQARWRAGVGGIAAVAGGVGAAEAVAVVLVPNGSPLFAAGSLVIDLSPLWLKTVVIDIFGTADKAVIIICLALLLAGLGVLAGLLERARPPWGRAVIAGMGVAGLLTAVTRSGGSVVSALPSAARSE